MLMLLSKVTSPLVLIGHAASAPPHGRYCAFQPILGRPNLAACIQLYYGPITARLDYFSFDNHHFFAEYDAIERDGDKIVLKRHGKPEGFGLFPFFNFKFDLRVSSNTIEIVPYATSLQKLTFSHEKCTPPEGLQSTCYFSGTPQAGSRFVYTGYAANGSDTAQYTLSIVDDSITTAPSYPTASSFFDHDTFGYFTNLGILFLGQPDPLSEELFEVAGVCRHDGMKNEAKFYPPHSSDPYIITGAGNLH
ncbi:hypothetical protein FOZ60_001175 [Perkinsus olseni]|uniref:Uncharacterized protein n=1 Tax=Perkinsus olseni TaxID=32597 RepID=A0A7J6P0Z1_PEROL|nr:hypothetical protein FOZ60_001175 [Perkinsus olseni]